MEKQSSPIVSQILLKIENLIKTLDEMKLERQAQSCRTTIQSDQVQLAYLETTTIAQVFGHSGHSESEEPSEDDGVVSSKVLSNASKTIVDNTIEPINVSQEADPSIGRALPERQQMVLINTSDSYYILDNKVPAIGVNGERSGEIRFCVVSSIVNRCLPAVCENVSLCLPLFLAENMKLLGSWCPIRPHKIIPVYMKPPAKPPDGCLSLLQGYRIWYCSKYWDLVLSSIQRHESLVWTTIRICPSIFMMATEDSPDSYHICRLSCTSICLWLSISRYKRCFSWFYKWISVDGVTSMRILLCKSHGDGSSLDVWKNNYFLKVCFHTSGNGPVHNHLLALYTNDEVVEEKLMGSSFTGDSETYMLNGSFNIQEWTEEYRALMIGIIVEREDVMLENYLGGAEPDKETIQKYIYFKVVDGNSVYDKGKCHMYDKEWYEVAANKSLKVNALAYNSVCTGLRNKKKFEEVFVPFYLMMKGHKSLGNLTITIGSFYVMVDDYCAQAEIKEVSHEWSLMNKQKLTVMRKHEEITKEKYEAFYKSLIGDQEECLALKHCSVEGQLEFEVILLMLQSATSDLFGTKKKPDNINLGMWQQNKTRMVIGKYLAKCIELFQEIAENKEDYYMFYEALAKKLKLGVHEGLFASELCTPMKSNLVITDTTQEVIAVNDSMDSYDTCVSDSSLGLVAENITSLSEACPEPLEMHLITALLLILDYMQKEFI